MAKMFDRYLRITAAGLDVSNLDADFNIIKNLKHEPNTCELKIYNLNPTHRAQLHALQNLPVEVKAGYKGSPGTPGQQAAAALGAALGAVDFNNAVTPPGDISAPNDSEALLFKGDVRLAYSKKEGEDWVTYLSTQDGGKAHKEDRIQKSFIQTTTQSIVTELIKAYNVDGKKAITRLAVGDVPELFIAKKYTSVISGKVSEELHKRLFALGLSGSVQDGELIILKDKEFLGTEVIILTSDHLLDSPEPGHDGLLQLKTLIQPRLKPGYQLSILGKTIKGLYRIEKVVYTGNTYSNDWYATIDAKSLT